MKFNECLLCIYRNDEEETCLDCDSGELFEEDDGLDFENGNIDNDR